MLICSFVLGKIQKEPQVVSTDVVDDIVAFWLGSGLESPDAAIARLGWWYAGGSSVDEEIRSRFGGHIEQACGRRLMEWRSTPNGAFALVLLLDQFTRNIYRGTPEAYAGDVIALEVAQHAAECGLDHALHPVARIWLHHPFHHSEQIAEQDNGLVLLNELVVEAPVPWQPYIRRSISGWTRHRDIVARFGRFPHRNHVLGRATTDEERAFLTVEKESFGQGSA